MAEITFAAAEPEELLAEAIKTVEAILGRKLERADPLRLFIEALVAVIIQLRLLIDEVAKMNLLMYAKGEYLDQLGAFVGCSRLEAQTATTTVRLKLSEPRDRITAIKAGTRLTADDEVYFRLMEPVIFNAGETEKVATAVSEVTGEAGNGYLPGEIDKVVDVTAYLESVVNETRSEGGSDRESDEHYRARIRGRLDSYSSAGSRGAYEYWARTASPLVVDAKAVSPTPAVVDVYILTAEGLPGSELLEKVASVLTDKKVRPLTDKVNVKRPAQVDYDLVVSYWISQAEATRAESIHTEVARRIEGYIAWQRGALGRDLNPSELVYQLKAAGVKRVEVTSPSFCVLSPVAIAICAASSVKYEGLEEE